MASKPPTKRFKIKNSPLTDPFPLPGNYRPDVQVALSSGKMTGVTKTAFYTQVAGAIFRVASEIVRQHPFLGSTKECGTKTVEFILLHNNYTTAIQYRVQ